MQLAELIWARYDKDQTTSKTYLLIYLGETEGNSVALIADDVTDNEITIFRRHLPAIRSGNITTIGQFIRDNMPIAYKNAYRHFKTNKLTILRSYGLQEIQTKNEKNNLPPEA